MEDAFVISGLTRKRAELDGEIRQTEQRVAKLRLDLDAIDRAILVLDPTAVVYSIKPRSPRPVAAGQHGGFTRAVLGTLRQAEAPLTARDIANRVAPLFGLNMRTADARNAVINRIRGALTRTRTGVVGERRGETVFWRVE